MVSFLLARRFPGLWEGSAGMPVFQGTSIMKLSESQVRNDEKGCRYARPGRAVA
jgi:hypothetical protein